MKHFRLWMTTYIARSESRPTGFERHPWLIG